MIGVDPGPLTLRELLLMHEARDRNEWGRTASLLAAIWTGTTIWSAKPKAFTPDEMNPYTERARAEARAQMTATEQVDAIARAVLG